MEKAVILKAIQRLAFENRGVVPGRLALASQAGIKETAWREVHWAKYSDAVREAGLEPNKKGIAYPKVEPLQALARITKDLGRFPTTSELQMKASGENRVPNDLARRLGTRIEMLAQLLEYSDKRPEFNEVAGIYRIALFLAQEQEAEVTVDSSLWVSCICFRRASITKLAIPTMRTGVSVN